MNVKASLTPRETEVAELLAWGAAKKEVSDRLFISTRTVENTARNIYGKIGIQKATELCVWWFCTHCGVSFDLSPIKRTFVSMVILCAFIHSDVMALKQTERYFRRNVRNTRSSITTERRFYRKDETTELDYLLI
jgi:DNA-binding CsgD family transcriptional regulator